MMKNFTKLLAISGLMALSSAASASNTTDYFRSAASGNWATAGSWQSSTDSVNWVASTLAPTSASSAIIIRATHTITVAAAASGDQITILSGGVLTQTAANLTLNDGAGDDLTITSGGSLTINGNFVIIMGAGSPTVNVLGGGVISSNNSPLIAATHTNNYVYNTGAVSEYSGTGALAFSGKTYFPNADANTIPILRLSSVIPSALGGASATVINGVLEVTGSAIMTGTSLKTLRNGIIGTGTLTTNSVSTPILINGTTASLGGGTLTLQAPLTINAGTVVTMTTNKTVNGSTFVVNGTLNTNGFILSGTTGFQAAASGILNITDAAGITSAGASGNIQTTGRTYNANATYQYSGSVAQVTGNGLPASVAGLSINNATGVTLSQATTLTGNLDLTNGVLTTTATELLSLGNAATTTNASNASFVNGPLLRNTNTIAAYTFPVGKGAYYMPVVITPTATTASTYTTEFMRGFQTTPHYAAVNAPLASVDASEYFLIDRSIGGAIADITLPWSTSTNVTNFATIVVAHDNGTSWDNLGGIPIGSNAAGTVTAAAVNDFGPFAIGSLTVQPLPVKINRFDLQKRGNEALLNWELQTLDGSETATLERSSNGHSFTAIYTAPLPKMLSATQSYTDAAPASGLNNYRLAVKAGNGVTTYSKVLSVTFGKNSSVHIYPNPATTALQIDWNDASVIATIQVTNSAGQVVYTNSVNGTHLDIATDMLVAGQYFVTFQQGELVQHTSVQVSK